jgi:tetratricopeptide (TPR) repeat protein
MHPLTLQQKMKEIENLSMQGDYEAALALLNTFLSEYPFVTRMLIKKGELIQLLPEASELGELSDAQEALELAVEIEPKSVEAILELAHFYSAVLDQEKESEKLFNQAIQLCFEFLEEAYLGKIESLISRGSAEARQWSQEAQELFPASVDKFLARNLKTDRRKRNGKDKRGSFGSIG